MHHRCLFASTLLFFCAAVTIGAAASKVETIGACTSPDFSDAVKASLQAQGFRVSTDAGVLCDVWLAKTLQQSSGSANADYGTLIPGSFAGVIAFPAAAGDYKGKAIPPGSYTMRYQTMPADGNHMGVSPTPDYFLLSPAGADQDPAAVIDYEPLLALSRKASKTNHPSPLFLTAPTAGGSLAFKDTGDGHWALETKTKAKAKGGSAEIDFPLAIVLLGKGESQ